MSKNLVIRHGSEDSLDIDIYVVIPEPIFNLQECKTLCESYVGYNANLITIENGNVSWCYKGTIDECNNSILATYYLHKENTEPCPITSVVERNLNIKIDRTIRGLLSYLSRTQYRTEVKAALKNDSIILKLNVLDKIILRDIKDFGKKGENKDVYKFFAFQLAQTNALLLSGAELFTKSDASLYYPQLAEYLKRNISDPNETVNLQKALSSFLYLVRHKYLTNTLY